MDKIYRILGKRGRTTVPYELRVKMGIHPNDLVSFRCEGDEIIIKREKICDNCKKCIGLDNSTEYRAIKIDGIIDESLDPAEYLDE